MTKWAGSSTHLGPSVSDRARSRAVSDGLEGRGWLALIDLMVRLSVCLSCLSLCRSVGLSEQVDGWVAGCICVLESRACARQQTGGRRRRNYLVTYLGMVTYDGRQFDTQVDGDTSATRITRALCRQH